MNTSDQIDAILADLAREERSAHLAEMMNNIRMERPVIRYDEPECVVPFIVPNQEPHRQPGFIARVASFVYTKLARKRRRHAE